MSDIFISYSRKDKAFATRLHEALKTRQREAWVDLEDIPPTAEWRKKIRAGIEGARAFVFVLSPDSMASPECLKEVDHATASHKRLIPVVCREVNIQAVPEALGKLNWIFLREHDDFDQGLDTLLTAVDTDLEWVDAHTSLLEKAAEWDRKGRDKSLLLRGGELREAEAWQVKSADKEPKPTELMASFIVSSRQGETRRQRYLLGGVSTGLVIALVLAALAFYQYRVADKRGRIALSRQLAAQSGGQLERKFDLALLFSVAALKVENTIEGRSSVFSALQKEPRLQSLLHGHKDVVWSVAFSPDGKTLASGSEDGTVILWDPTTRQPLGPPLLGHQKAVNSVAFSPDGKTLASGSDDQTIILWDLSNRRPLALPLQAHTSEVARVAFSPDNTILATAGLWDKTIILWDLKTLKPLAPPLRGHKAKLTSLAFSPDGKTLASGGDNSIILWDLKTFKPLGSPLQGHKNSVLSLAFSPDGKTLASGSWDDTIILWDLARRQPLGAPLPRHDKVALVRGQQKPKMSEGQKTPGLSLAFSPDGKTLASGSWDNLIILWDVDRRQPLGSPLQGQNSWVESVAFSPDGQILVSGGDNGTVVLWDLARRYPLGSPLKGHKKEVMQVAFSPDGKTLASGSNDHTIILWDVARRQPLALPLQDPEGRVMSIAFHPNGKTLASGNWAESITLDPRGTRVHRQVPGTIMLWDLGTFKPLGPPLQGHLRAVLSVAFSPDGTILASGSDDETIILWDVARRQPLGPPLQGHKNRVNRVAFSPDGKTLASAGSWDKTLRLWDVASRQPLGGPLIGHTKAVTDVAFSPDGRTLASGSEDQAIILWDMGSRQPLGPPLRAHQEAVKSVAFSPDGQTLVSGSWDSTVILWDVGSRQPLGPPLQGHKSIVNSVAFSPNGQILASGSWDKTIILWDVFLPSWQEHACRIANRNLSREEWQQYLGDLPYRKTCPNLPEPEAVKRED